ncbi:MAG: hypothetical protein EBZ48_15100 [Proteobacteria bacterium]|nr:hypothetical protein [Pseudomonadota bacterium]
MPEVKSTQIAAVTDELFGRMIAECSEAEFERFAAIMSSDQRQFSAFRILTYLVENKLSEDAKTAVRGWATPLEWGDFDLIEKLASFALDFQANLEVIA